MEVMGLMLGEFVDEYTVKVVDVFAMPQSGTGVSVEAVDPVFQTKMLDMLKQCGRRAAPAGGARRQDCAAATLEALDALPQWPHTNFILCCSGQGTLRSLEERARADPVRGGGCAGQRWWSAGTTATPALAAGCPAWTSTRSRRAPPARCRCSVRRAGVLHFRPRASRVGRHSAHIQMSPC
jgi:hypothetical protein